MTTTSPAASPATFGVSVQADGSIETIRTGQFDAGHTEAIAQQLVLLAAAIRASARERLAQTRK